MRWILFWAILIPNLSLSQIRTFAGVGGNVYRGEIGANIVREIGLVDFNFRGIRPIGVAGVVLNVNPNHSLGLTIQASSLYGEDRFSNQKDFYRRNWKMNGKLGACETFYTMKIFGAWRGLIGIGTMFNSYEVRDGDGKLINSQPFQNFMSMIVPCGIVWEHNKCLVMLKTTAVLNDNLEGMQMQGSRKCDYFTSLSISQTFPLHSNSIRTKPTNCLITKRGECPTF